MADIKPFQAIRYSSRFGTDLSDLIAPPYDVLDGSGKSALLSRSPRNIVEIDLPHLPAKQVGPDECYVRSADTLNRWLADGTLIRDSEPAIYAYTQVFTIHGRTYHRRGFFAVVKLEPFSTPTEPTQIVPHEKTYPDAIIDRLKLTTATGVQLSPIFGLFPDETGIVNQHLYSGLGPPPITGTLDGVVNQLWPVTDKQVIDHVTEAMKSRKIYIADGHHRYTMALAYQKQVAEAYGGRLPEDHPANYCLFVLLSMHDPGCVILPTHRIVGNLKSFDLSTFRQKLSGVFTVQESGYSVDQIRDFEQAISKESHTVFGLYDAKTRRLYTLRLIQPDILASHEPGQSPAWRRLDVAILRRYLLDEIIQPTFADGDVKLAYTAYADEIPTLTDGEKYPLALILRPTPLKALEDLGVHGEVMPQKSTFFYPKLATGLVINPVS
ncbi:MAG: phosphatase [Phycisphaerae bacterium]|jgi:uncharacterized protein (DUF1015 family)|nr:MAG: phosphatase [Phycisphaerae bacterium]